MIKFSYIDRQLKARLDAEGSDAYDINLDRIPAINGAQHLVQSAVDSLMDRNKYPGELLRDLNYTAVFQTDKFGQVSIDTNLGVSTMPVDLSRPQRAQRLWTVIAVYPEFVPAGTADVIADTTPTKSRLREDLRFIRPIKAAKRWTQEQWDKIKDDPWAPGNSVLTNSLKEYGYVVSTRPLTTDRWPSMVNLSIMPHTDGTNKLVAISYLKSPFEVLPMPLGEADTAYDTVLLEWPESMAELLISVALRVISYKQGDGTTLNALSTQELSMLMNAKV